MLLCIKRTNNLKKKTLLTTSVSFCRSFPKVSPAGKSFFPVRKKEFLRKEKSFSSKGKSIFLGRKIHFPYEEKRGKCKYFISFALA